MILEKDYGVVMNHKKIIRIMKTYNFRVKIRRKSPYKAAIKQHLSDVIHPNILDRNFSQVKPNAFYCTDITYLGYKNDKTAYLSALKDIASGEIVSYTLSKNLKLDFVIKMIEKVIELSPKNSLDNLIIHSDGGIHYRSNLYQALLKKYGIIQSMSRKANCLDNAPIESFFGHLKDDIDYKKCNTFEELQEMIDNYMYDYNNNRYQWNKNKMSPVEYRQYLLAG